jgi:hypothetical protein
MAEFSLKENAKKLNIPKYDYSAIFERFPQVPEIKQVFENVHFNPSPEELEFVFLMAKQESGLQWNPELNKVKKEKIVSIKNEILGKLPDIMLSQEEEIIKDQLRVDLDNILKRKNATEYDFYEWTRELNMFIDRIEKKYPMIGFIPGFKEKKMRLEHEPRTFGLFQIDVNLLGSKLEKSIEFRYSYPKIFTNGKINRDELIKCLSGKTGAAYDKTKTLELIATAYLKPRHENHMRGTSDDLKYFIMESLSGEMSTYRAAVQQRLNIALGFSLALDGDLSFYKPYSTEIDQRKTSGTQKALSQFIEEKAPDLRNNKRRLVREICEADSWEKLRQSVLYRRIMGTEAGKRISPKIKSELYGQSADQYANIISRERSRTS